MDFSFPFNRVEVGEMRVGLLVSLPFRSAVLAKALMHTHMLFQYPQPIATSSNSDILNQLKAEESVQQAPLGLQLVHMNTY